MANNLLSTSPDEGELLEELRRKTLSAAIRRMDGDPTAADISTSLKLLDLYGEFNNSTTEETELEEILAEYEKSGAI